PGGYATLTGMWYAIAKASGANTVTLTATSDLRLLAWQILEFSGTATASVQDGSGVVNSGTGTPTTVTVTTNGANELVIAMVNASPGATYTPNTGWTQAGTGGYGAIYSTEATAGSYTASFAQSNGTPWGAGGAAFIPGQVATSSISLSGAVATVSNADSAYPGFAEYYTTDGSTPTT